MFYSLIIKDDPISLDIANHISEKIQLKKDDKNPDIVICVGGDGTILQAAHKFPNAIIFGLHTGHLGFFANYNPDNVDELIAMKIPYGETKASYERLTTYLYRANTIHSQISKNLQKL